MVIFQHLQLFTGIVAKCHMQRCCNVAVGFEVIFCIGRHINIMIARNGGHFGFTAAVETDGIKLLLQPAVFGRQVIDLFCRRVDAGNFYHVPVAFGNLVDQLAIIAVTVNMVIARTVRHPEKLLLLFGEVNHVVNVGIKVKNSYPGGVFLFEHHVVLAGFHVKKIKLHVVLGAV